MMRLPARLHATTWWAIAILAAWFATLTANPAYLLMVSVLSLLAMKAFRDQTLRSKSVLFYLTIALSVIATRLIFRIIFNQPDSFQPTALYLPLITVAETFSILGPVSQLSLQAAIIDGLRLAAIILAIGMANTVANPRKLLRSTPGALYEVATAAAVAINLAPQLVESMHRVRRARKLRSKSTGFRAFRMIVIPVLEDALDKSLSLAASMDSRGFGRQETISRNQSATTRTMSIAALFLLAIGSFMLLTVDFFWFSVAALGVGTVLVAVTFRLQSKRRIRTFYRPEKPGFIDWSVLVVVAIILWIAVNFR